MPNIRPLKYKPLVEAVLEIRWAVSQQEGDPHYTLFPGRLYDHMVQSYPFHEPLPTAIVPQPIIRNVVQHRFRVAKDAWPLIQVGPGIVTLNDTEGYEWRDFGDRAKTLVDEVFRSYPKPEELNINSLLLRYIDAVEFADTSEDVFDFLYDKLKTKISLPPNLFEDVAVGQIPAGVDFKATFPASSPSGTITVRFATGTKSDNPVIVWETAVHSENENVPQMPQGFSEWAESAHCLTDDWFFKLIEGELERRFAGEE